jgi:hypothetical protein
MEKLMTIGNFARQYPSKRNGTGVNVGYIYKLIKQGKNAGWDLVVIDGVHFIKTKTNDNANNTAQNGMDTNSGHGQS